MPYRTGFPLPNVDDRDTREWWAQVKQHKLVIQRCSRCNTFRHPPVPVCFKCRSFEYGWAPVSGKGVVFSYTIAYHPPAPAMQQLVPYNVVIVELPEAQNIRMVGNLLDAPNGQIKVGLPVEVTFEDISDKITLPQWRVAR